MPTKIRLARRGKKRKPIYDIVVADSRAPRDGRFIEKLGSYNPNTNPSTIRMDEDKALYWVMTGAQPTDTARKLLSVMGVMLRKHLQIGVEKGAITQETADSRYQQWVSSKKLENLEFTSETRKAKEALAAQHRAEEEAKSHHSEEHAPAGEATSEEA